MRLEVKRPGGEWFVARGEEGNENETALRLPEHVDAVPPSVTLAPGEEKRADYLAGPDSPPWFADRRLHQVGTYRFRIVADENFARSRTPGSDPVISNEVEFSVEEPTGADAAVWDLIRANPVEHRASLAGHLWTAYPASLYTAITARPGGGRMDAQHISDLEAALAKNPPAGFADVFRKAIADIHLKLMEDAIDEERDADAAYQHSQAARAILEELTQKETEAKLRAAAKQSLDTRVMSLADIQRNIKDLTDLFPVASCDRTAVETVGASVTRSIDDQSATPKSKRKLQDVLHELNAYLIQVNKSAPDMVAALEALERAAGDIETAVKQGLIGGDLASPWLAGLAASAETSARKAVDAAQRDVGVKQSDLSLARQKLQEANELRTAGDFRQAMARYRQALHKAQTASKVRAEFC